jgi:hypothetical protein
LRRLRTLAISLGVALCLATPAAGFPLDGAEETGIIRLEAYSLAQDGRVRGPLLPPGARLAGDEIQLRLLEHPDLVVPPPDPVLSDALRSMLGADADAYGLVVLDVSDPLRPRFGAHNPDLAQSPGSVGKLLIDLGWFQALADRYPDDLAARHALMRDTIVPASDFIQSDSHNAPFWQPGDSAVDFRPIRMGDQGNLWTWLDWMSSSSSNAAASVVASQIVLLRHFGSEYPVSSARAEQFFRETPKARRTELLREAIQAPAKRAGLDLTQLRQGGLFTRTGRERLPGTNSTSTPRELMHFMLKLEQGRLVDPDSSLAMKKLIFLTERRIRYARSLALRRAALYFKSGSLYNCSPEPGFVCEKYQGNVRNLLNSVVIVESGGEGAIEPRLHYIVALLSNVLRKDSAQLHRQLATEIHEILLRDHAAPRQAPAAEPIDEMDFDEDAATSASELEPGAVLESELSEASDSPE